MDNYSYVIKKGRYTPYNMLSFFKVLNGDTSDDIAPLPVEQSQPLLDMLDSDFYRARMGDKEFMRATLEFAAPWVLPQFDLVYPLDVATPDDIAYGNKQLVKEFGSEMKNSNFDYITNISQKVKDAIKQMAEDGLYID